MQFQEFTFCVTAKQIMEPPTKLAKTEENAIVESGSFANFEFVEILSDNPDRKFIAVLLKHVGCDSEDEEANANGSHHDDAIILMDKKPFSAEVVKKMISTGVRYDVEVQNDIYRNCTVLLPIQLNGTTVTPRMDKTRVWHFGLDPSDVRCQNKEKLFCPLFGLRMSKNCKPACHTLGNLDFLRMSKNCKLACHIFCLKFQSQKIFYRKARLFISCPGPVYRLLRAFYKLLRACL